MSGRAVAEVDSPTGRVCPVWAVCKLVQKEVLVCSRCGWNEYGRRDRCHRAIYAALCAVTRCAPLVVTTKYCFSMRGVVVMIARIYGVQQERAGARWLC